MRFEHAIGHDLGPQAVVEARDCIATFANGRDEFPNQIIAENRGRLPLAGVARATFWS